MINYKIIVATLKGCSRCSEIVKLLKEENIIFTEVPCDKDSGLCDELESYTKTGMYPMLVLVDSETKNNYIYYSGTDFNLLNKEVFLKDKLYLTSGLNVTDIFHNLKNKLNK